MNAFLVYIYIYIYIHIVVYLLAKRTHEGERELSQAVALFQVSLRGDSEKNSFIEKITKQIDLSVQNYS